MIIASIFTGLQNAIFASSGGILDNSLALGNDIFITIFVAMVVIGLCKCAIAQDFNMFWWNLGSLLFKMIPPIAALNFARLILPNIKTITDYFTGRITGGSASDAESLSHLALQVSVALFQAASVPLRNPGVLVGSVISNPGNIPIILLNELVAFIVSMVVTFCFTWVAVELVLAWYQVLLSSAIGAASVGFFGSDATADMAFRYTSGVISGMWKVIFMTVWPSTVIAVYNQFTFIPDIADPDKYMMTSVNIVAFALIVVVATTRIVKMADTMFTGQSTFTAQDIGNTVTGAVKSAIKAVKKK